MICHEFGRFLAHCFAICGSFDLECWLIVWLCVVSCWYMYICDACVVVVRFSYVCSVACFFGFVLLSVCSLLLCFSDCVHFMCSVVFLRLIVIVGVFRWLSVVSRPYTSGF